MGYVDSDEDVAIGLSSVDISNSSSCSDGAYLIILSGLPGTGKSYFAKQISELVPCAVVSSDRVRKALFVAPEYTRYEHSRVFSVCHEIIKRLLMQSCKVVFDATNLNEGFRQPLYDIANQSACPFTLVAISAHIDTVTERLRLRMEVDNSKDYSDADINVYHFLRNGRQSISEPHIKMLSPRDNPRVLKELISLFQSVDDFSDS